MNSQSEGRKEEPKAAATATAVHNKTPWPHAPAHQLSESGTHFVTAGTYLARLNYAHQNPVKHGLVRVANLYPWCSAAWFERTTTPAQFKTIYGFRTDRVNVYDEYPVEGEW